jgi:hypothetical protein
MDDEEVVSGVPGLSKSTSTDSRVSASASLGRLDNADAGDSVSEREIADMFQPGRVVAEDDSDDDSSASEEADIEPESEDDVPLGVRHPEALSAQLSLRERERQRKAEKTSAKTQAKATRPAARNPFGFAPDELSRKLVKVQQQRDPKSVDAPAVQTESSSAHSGPHVGHSLLPQTDESVLRRGARSRSHSSQGAQVEEVLSPPVPPFIHNAVLTCSEDETDSYDEDASRISQPTPPRSETSSRRRRSSIGAGVKRALTGHGNSKKKSAPPLPAIDTTVTGATARIDKARPSPTTATSSSSIAGSQRATHTIYVGGMGHFLLLDVPSSVTVKAVIEQVHARGELKGEVGKPGDWAMYESWLHLGIGESFFSSGGRRGRELIRKGC